VLDGSAPTDAVVVSPEPLLRIMISRTLAEMPQVATLTAYASSEEAAQMLAVLEPSTDAPPLLLLAAECFAKNASGLCSSRLSGVIVFAGLEDAARAHQVLLGCVNGYLSRRADEEQLRAAVSTVLAGRVYVDRYLQDELVLRWKTGIPAPHALFTPREREVVGLLAAGMTTAQIGRTLFVSATTAKTHIERIYEKLGVRRRAAAVAELARLGMLDESVQAPNQQTVADLQFTPLSSCRYQAAQSARRA
jgi:DNA-binding NarL/FixJ family response regulator